jgi:hypothetical protein
MHRHSRRPAPESLAAQLRQKRMGALADVRTAQTG